MKTEEIEKAAEEYATKLDVSTFDYKAARKDFREGADFANKHWQEKTKSNLENLFKDKEFIENLCFSYRHDFGLLDFNKQTLIRFECKEWLRAIINNWKEIE